MFSGPQLIANSIAKWDVDKLKFGDGQRIVVEQLLCQINGHISSKLNQCDQCQSVVCHECLSSVAEQHKCPDTDRVFKRCPFCKLTSKYNSWNLQPFAIRLLDSVELQCPQCSQPSSLCSIDRHLLECTAGVQRCSSCGEAMTPQAFKEHIRYMCLIAGRRDKDCRGRRQCPLCFDQIRTSVFNIDDCPIAQNEIQCPACPAELEASRVKLIDITSHIKNNLDTHLPVLLSRCNLLAIESEKHISDWTSRAMIRNMQTLIKENADLRHRNMSMSQMQSVSCTQSLREENAMLRRQLGLKQRDKMCRRMFAFDPHPETLESTDQPVSKRTRKR